MQKTFKHSRLFSRVAHATSLATLSGLTLISLSQPISIETDKSIANTVFNVSFSDFSPAFAAFEDEFLFSDDKEGVTLAPGSTNQIYKRQLEAPSHDLTPKIQVLPAPRKLGFDGSASIEKMSIHTAHSSKRHSQLIRQASQPQPRISGEELKFGSLVTLTSDTSIIGKSNRPQSPEPITQPAVVATNTNSPEVTQMEQQDSPAELMTRVSGQFQLKQGLAFLGSMEVSWVVGDYEWSRGSINTQDATYTIPVDKLIGDVVFSLYDNQDQLIGEGFLDLTRHQPIDGKVYANIDVLPIDWDMAGKVIDAYSLGMNQFDIGFKPKTIKDVNIQLYAFNESTKTNDQGTFSFFNWKKSNSRTLAIAAKNGFADSIFSLDSRTQSSVILFPESYINNLLQTLEQQGMYGLADKGIIYGALVGPETSGYSVAISGHKPVYFQSGIPWIKNEQTSSDGLFTFVGLEDGDYEVEIIKDGEIIDHKIIVVEQGKVSPIMVNLKKITKHLQYFNPLNPDTNIEQVVLSFFDGQEVHQPDTDNVIPVTIALGSSPSLIDYSINDSKVVRTFVSRSRDLQRLPLLQGQTLTNLALEADLPLHEGLIIGFVEQVGEPEPFNAFLLESPANKIIYFNSLGKTVDPNQEVPFGFILGGFARGLSSLLLERLSDGTILTSDFVFSDHQAISIVNLLVSPID